MKKQKSFLSKVDEIKAYNSRDIELASGLIFNHEEKLKEIQFATNSAYLSGKYDQNGREKPYNNVVNANVVVANVATDIDRKDMNIEGDNPDQYYNAFIYRRCNYEWMKESKFGITINRINETRNRYGGVLVKKSKDEKGELRIDVVKWKNVSVDPTDILGGTIIETHWMYPSELRKKEEVWENIDDAIDLIDDEDSKIEIKEIHGEFEKSWLDDGDSDEFIRQVHIIAVKDEEYVTLHKAEEKENPYKYDALTDEDGRELGRGFVEEGLEAQVWTNDMTIHTKNAIEAASKVILKSNSRRLSGNIFNDADNGDVLFVEDGKTLEKQDLLNTALPEFQKYADMWQRQYDRSVQITDALRGETPPSGQAYRLGALVTQQASSRFDYIREDLGFFLEEIFNDWIFPYLQKKLRKGYVFSSNLFSTEELIMLDGYYSNARANDVVREALKKGKAVSIEQYQAITEQFRQLIGQSGQSRFIKTFDKQFKDFKPKLTLNTTNEQKNKMASLDTLSSILQTVGSNPAILQDPDLRMIFSQLMETAGSPISPVQLSNRTQVTPEANQGQSTEVNIKSGENLNLPGPEAVKK